jgi:hypothetical protein
MGLFTKNKEFRVRGLVLKLINTNCPSLRSQINEARVDSRVSLAVVVTVVPLEDGQIRLDEAFTTVSKDFSSTGMAMVLEKPLPLDQAIVAFRVSGEMAYVRAEARHMHPIGGDYHQLGFRLIEIVSTADYPGLESVTL